MGISVIIPTFNEAAFIDRTIRHIRHCGGSLLTEILVVDGGSTDQTMFLAQAAGARVLQAPKKGRGAQMHYGAKSSMGDVLYFVHADTLPPSTFASDITGALEQGWKMGNFQYSFDSPRLLLRINAFFTRFRWFFTQGGDRTFFIRKETYLELGGYDPGMPIMEEYEFLRRAQRQGCDFIMLPGKCLVSARKYARNSWLRVQLANLLTYQLWARGYATPDRLRRLYERLLR